MYWGRSFASKLTGKHKVSTGISPSGYIHFGNVREVMTGDIIHKSIQMEGMESSFIYLCDDIDPLRKVYPFLPESYEKHVGKPLRDIPAPDGNLSYSEFFIQPFIETMKKLNISPEIIRTGELYRDGKLGDLIEESIKKKDQIRQILEQFSGRELENDWYPYNPRCSQCGRINSAKATGFSNGKVSYQCTCGFNGESDIYKDEGKLPWRIEWPAKWKILGVTVEPFGKDHGTQGGSYDTGKAISETVFNYPAPAPMMFERILLKGKGAMHSSTGINIPASEMLKFSPPEIIRYVIARVPPTRYIDFDPGSGFLNLVDEYERLHRLKKEGKLDEDKSTILEICETGRDQEQIPDFRHLTTLVQIYSDDKRVSEIISSDGKTYSPDILHERIDMARDWIKNHAPEDSKFRILGIKEKTNLTEEQRKVICELHRVLDSKTEWTPESIHESSRVAIESSGLEPSAGFVAIYMTIIGKERGPRLGYFLAGMDRNTVLSRLEFVCGDSP